VPSPAYPLPSSLPCRGVPTVRLLEVGGAVVGGLLSSSCCAVQLALNALSLGCAGFAVLDKLRPAFLALTVTGLTAKALMYDVRSPAALRRAVPTWLLALGLAATPELVKMVNR
jgi:hypothetical protein